MRLLKPTIANQNVIKSIEWVKGQELFEKLILSFMALLAMCALSLILGMELVAEQFANVAYLALIIVVGIKFAKLIKEEWAKKEGR